MQPQDLARVHALIAQWREMWSSGLSASNSLREHSVYEGAAYERGKADARRFDADALEAALAAARQQEVDEVQVGIPLVEAVYRGTVQQSYPLHAQDEKGRCRSWCYGCERRGLIERIKFTENYESVRAALAAAPQLDFLISVNAALHAVQSPWRIDRHPTGQAIAVPTPEIFSSLAAALAPNTEKEK